MPMKVSEKAWDRWETTIQKLHNDFEFPAETREALSGYFTLFQGDGSTFRLETSSWKMVLDVIRTRDDITDIVAITLASKLDSDSSKRGGWIITARCPNHPQPQDPSQEPPAMNPSDMSDLFWYKIEEGGKVSAHCCKQECEGPYKPNSWKAFDAVRKSIVIKTLEHEVIKSRSIDKSNHREEEDESGLKAQLAEAIREKKELQAQLDAMVHTNTASCKTPDSQTALQAENKNLPNSPSRADYRIPFLEFKLSNIAAQKEHAHWLLEKKRFEFQQLRAAHERSLRKLKATKEQEVSLQTTLDEALREISALQAGDPSTGFCPDRRRKNPPKTPRLGFDAQTQGPCDHIKSSQSLAVGSRSRQIEIIDLTESPVKSESPKKNSSNGQGKQSQHSAVGQSSPLKRSHRKRKRSLESAATDDEDATATPRKRKSKSRGHGSRVKIELEV